MNRFDNYLNYGIDIVSSINTKYLELYKNMLSDKTEKSILLGNGYNFSTVTELFSSTFEVSFRKHDFKLDLDKIDINKSLEENWIYLKLLEIKIKNNQNIKVNIELINYIQNILVKDKGNIELYRVLDKEILIPYVNYMLLEHGVKIKDKTNKPKSKV